MLRLEMSGIFWRAASSTLSLSLSLSKRVESSVFETKRKQQFRPREAKISRPWLMKDGVVLRCMATRNILSRAEPFRRFRSSRVQKIETKDEPVTQMVTNLEPKCPAEAQRQGLGCWLCRWPAMMHSWADRKCVSAWRKWRTVPLAASSVTRSVKIQPTACSSSWRASRSTSSWRGSSSSRTESRVDSCVPSRPPKQPTHQLGKTRYNSVQLGKNR